MFKGFLGKLRKLHYNINSTAENVIDVKAKISQQFLLEHILNDKKSGVSEKQYCSEEIVVSLTSYGRRLYDVCFAIESIMQQTYKPNRIILWLDKEDYLRPLPEALLMQQKRGLDIRVYEPDIRSYKKLIPTLKEYPKAAIITIDDDLMYDFDILERLIKAYISDSTSIHACRIHQIAFDKHGKIKPYNQWNWCVKSLEENNKNFLTGVGAVIYPPNSLHKDVFKEDVFTRICRSADDVWFTTMAILNNTPIRKVQTRSENGEDYILNYSIQDMGLCVKNVNACENDIQIEKVFSHYDLWNIVNK